MSTTQRLYVSAAIACAAFLLPLFAFAAQTTVSIGDDFYNSKNITINQGDTVTWQNSGTMQHTVTADNGSFDSGTIQPGQTFSVTVNQPGTYSYYCKFHGGPGGQGMSGTITVLAGNSTSGSTVYVNPNVNYSNVSGSTPANTGSVAALVAQVQALMAQISAMQGQLGYAPSSGSVVPAAGSVAYNSSSCPLIGRSLGLGSSGDDVTRLQQFLARNPSVYPQGTVSGYYGALTQAAVQKWQIKYNIVSSGTPSTTGFGVVGPRTAAAISLLCTTGSYGGVSGPSGGAPSNVGGYVQVSPISGAAPLTVNVTATVNTTDSCAGAVYTLDFGDGSPEQQIPVAAGNCSQLNQTFQHVYTSGGTHQIQLSSQGHSTSATVTVSGGTNGNSNPSTPTGSMSAFTTSGNAPFSATFYVSCASGVAYNVVFGDGSDLGSTGVGQTTCNGSLQGVTHTYQNPGNYHAALEIFVQQSNGTITPSQVGTVAITVINPTAGYTYSSPQLTAGSSALAYTLQFDIPASCTGYDLSWGDGTAHNSQADGGSCGATATIITQTHTYAAPGSYTIVLRRGASLSQVDDIAVTVSQ